jgi:hypothetical protein
MALSLRTSVGLGFLGFFLVGCVPTTQEGLWLEGSTRAQTQSDETDCQLEALRKVPRETAVTSVPGYYTPMSVSPISTQCFGNGAYRSCTTTGGTVSGGQLIGGGVQTYDPNSALRRQVAEQCLTAKGYEGTSFPTCTPEQVKSGTQKGFTGDYKFPSKEKVLCVNADRSLIVLKPWIVQ